MVKFYLEDKCIPSLPPTQKGSTYGFTLSSYYQLKHIYIFTEKSSESTPLYSVLLTHTFLFFFLAMVCLNLSALLKALFTLFKPQFTLSDNPSL